MTYIAEMWDNRDPIDRTRHGFGWFVVLAYQLREPTGTALDVEACEWKVCHSRESADHWFSKWSEVYAFVNVRECGPVRMFSQPSGPDVVERLPADRFEAGGIA